MTLASDGFPRRWRARWIWFAEPPPISDPVYRRRTRPADAFGYLRRRFELGSVPATAPCRVTADGRYVLWVNGVLVGRGPARSEPSLLAYDTYDVALHLRAGPNAVAALVRHYGGPTIDWKPAPPCGDLGYGSFVLEVSLGDVLVVTDASWRGRRAPYDQPSMPFVEGPPPIEVIDGRAIPWGWTEPGYDDDAWEDAVELAPAGLGIGDPSPPSPPFTALGPRLAPPLDERIIEPALEPGGVPATIDLGRIVSGHVMLGVDAEPGAVVELACGEDADPDGRVVVAPRGWSLRYTAAGRAGEEIEAFEPVGFRYVAVAHHGAVRAVRVRVRERTAPRAAGAWFSSSDPMLDAIYAAGVRTLELCSADAFIDCPGRERRAWLGDAYVVTLVHLACNPDVRLPAWNLLLHGQAPRPDGLLPMVAAGDMSERPETIPDHALLWCAGLARFVEWSADHALARALLPVAVRALDAFERWRGDDGLLRDVPGWIFVDWAQIERGSSMAALDAMHVLALDGVASTADMLGDAGLSRLLRARATRTREAFEGYWDETRGAYVDARSSAGAGRRVSQQTNAIAIVAGCAPAERWERMLARVTDATRLIRTATPGDPGSLAERLSWQWTRPNGFDDEENVVLAQPFFAHFLHQAFARARRLDLLLPSIRRWRPLVERGNACLEEYWDAAPGLGSRCHAWSATPVYDLATHVLGVRPGGPGFDPIVIEPFLGDLAAASGAVPTPRGIVKVALAAGEEPVVEAPPGARVVLRWNGRERAL